MSKPPFTFRHYLTYAPGTGNTVTAVQWEIRRYTDKAVLASGSIASPIANGGNDHFDAVVTPEKTQYEVWARVTDSGATQDEFTEGPFHWSAGEYVYDVDLGVVPSTLTVETLDTYDGGAGAWYAPTAYYYAESTNGLESGIVGDWEADPATLLAGWTTGTHLLVAVRTGQAFIIEDGAPVLGLAYGPYDGVDRIIVRWT